MFTALILSLVNAWVPGFAMPAGEKPPGPQAQSMQELFVTADQCMACHNGMVSASGEDLSIGTRWRASMMANSARDPYWQAAVRREVIDHPAAQAAIENECAACHMPMARFEARAAGMKGQIFAHLPILEKDDRPDRLAADGVSCTMCHQIRDERLGQRESFTAGFEVDATLPIGRRNIFGPFEIDQGRTRIMHSASQFKPASARHLESSEFCATCHTLITHSLDPAGKVIGELPEQVPYLEWKHSAYRDSASCQSCHMAEVDGKTHITSVLGQPRERFSRHEFRGGNFFISSMLNRHSSSLGTAALPNELDSAVQHTVRHLETESARIAIEDSHVSGGRLEATVLVQNLAGHKLPTAYPSRRVWIRFWVTDANGKVVFESGGLAGEGSIRGNDNDEDPARYETHYMRIENEHQVQIYESVMQDSGGVVTTGLLAAIRFVKDNRILPRGFDKRTAAEDIAVHGAALADGDFDGGSDRIRYSIDLNRSAGPFLIRAELWYQPVGFRWARNLARVGAAETERFVSMYDSMAHSSGVVLARAESVAGAVDLRTRP